MKKNLSILLAAVMLLGAILACGGSADTGSSDSGPVAIGDLPVPDGVTQSSDEALQLGMQTMVENIPLKNTQGVTLDVPAGTTWDAVKSFYSTQLENNGWTAGEGSDSDRIQTWTRGNQTVVINLTDYGLILLLGDTQ